MISHLLYYAATCSFCHRPCICNRVLCTQYTIHCKVFTHVACNYPSISIYFSSIGFSLYSLAHPVSPIFLSSSISVLYLTSFISCFNQASDHRPGRTRDNEIKPLHVYTFWFTLSFPCLSLSDPYFSVSLLHVCAFYVSSLPLRSSTVPAPFGFHLLQLWCQYTRFVNH